MKKVFIFTFAIVFATITKAQLTVIPTGQVQISSSLSSTGPVSVNTSTSPCLSLWLNNPYSSTAYSLSSTATHTSGKTIYNLFAQTTDRATTTTGRCIGVYSAVKNLSGVNVKTGIKYGVCGVNEGNGFGVYGGTSTTLVSLDQPYAGYFNGNTHVQGNFTVSGNINGTLLTSAPSTAGRFSGVSTEQVREHLNDKFQGLTVSKFYYELPQKTSLSDEVVEDEVSAAAEEISRDNANFAFEDSVDYPEEKNVAEADLPMNAVEKQIYSKQHYCLSADELEIIFPDLVYEDENGSKSINYVEMVPILVQAIGELSAKVSELEGKDGTVKKVAAKTTGINDVDGGVDVLSLGQNKPNPFGTSTEIEVSVPESVQSAFVYVYDLQGKKVQQVNLTARGKQTVQLNAASLADGMYLYSLIADGKVVETRRMIVEK